MYHYDVYDQRLVNERVVEFRQQTRRYLDGKLSEDQFRPLRLMNGLYVERHAPMLRVAIPYGQLSSAQLRMLAHVARTYDRGWGHFTTRQNIQFNWPSIERTPDILADLASVQMHAIQSSGNCIRNITTDHLAGIDADEVADPRPWAELLRQWSTLHPEFAFLPRKFKIAIIGSERDRAATQVHDIGLRLVDHPSHGIGFEVLVGGGLGRTPVIGQVVRSYLHRFDLLSYVEAIMRIYNLQGRRDNLYKARIKILVKALGVDEFTRQVEAEFKAIRDSELRLGQAEFEAVAARFALPPYEVLDDPQDVPAKGLHDAEFADWLRQNTASHKQPGYRAVYLSLKAPYNPPGDLRAEVMDAVADLADEYSFGAIRTTHTQNLLLPDVAAHDLHVLWRKLVPLGLATPNIATVTDVICCPGLDFCSLANARSIPVSQGIQQRFGVLDARHRLGDIQIKISGCMNACAHHHVGHIGILGVDKNGEEWYQVTLGGSADEQAALGQRLGPAIASDRIVDVIETLLLTYVQRRIDADESFVDTVKRVGVTPFAEQVYG